MNHHGCSAPIPTFPLKGEGEGCDTLLIKSSPLQGEGRVGACSDDLRHAKLLSTIQRRHTS